MTTDSGSTTGTAATTLTYDDALTTDLSKVRFHIGDTSSSAGPLPDAGNFTDDELNGLITLESGWQRAVAAAFETIAARWRRYADITVGPRSEQLSQIAKGFAEQAKWWRDRYGTTVPIYVSGIIKKDGWSDDVATDDVTAGEYGIDFEYTRPERAK